MGKMIFAMCRFSGLFIDRRYNFCYTARMKTAISIPDSLFKKAEEFAKSNRISRSELYQRALAAFLSDAAYADVTRMLDEVYGDETLRVPRVIRRLQSQALKNGDEAW